MYGGCLLGGTLLGLRAWMEMVSKLVGMIVILLNDTNDDDDRGASRAAISRRPVQRQSSIELKRFESLHPFTPSCQSTNLQPCP